MIPAFLLGVASWSLLEYAIHRWLGHHRRLQPNLFGTEHTRHHAEGNYFAPAWKKLLAAVVVANVVDVLVGLFAGPDLALAFTLGLVGFYLVYEWVHYSLHAYPPRTPYGRWARRHHFHHHFHAPRTNHGVTSPVWDIVFGTRATPGVVRVPEKLAMPWLLADPDGYEGYALRRRP